MAEIACSSNRILLALDFRTVLPMGFASALPGLAFAAGFF
jgi:hypothetical protein